MKKKNFVTLVLSTVGGILFALGMCMALLPQWNAMNQGILLGGLGLAVLWRVNPSWKQNLFMTGLLWAAGAAAGMLLQLAGL